MRPDEETISAVLGGRMPRDTELGNTQATVILRSIPLSPTGEHTGALVLLRDVTDLRRRDRELVTKDATIREIHHRVKNNLQTVAALLRLQARRIGVPEGRVALEEAVRRVGAIAVVHETLSQAFDETVDFDDVTDRLTRLVTDVGSHGAPIRASRTGSFGSISSDAATPLAMVYTELIQNAVEHAFASERSGTIEIRCARVGDGLRLGVEDDGVGLPDGLQPRGDGQPGAVHREHAGGRAAGAGSAWAPATRGAAPASRCGSRTSRAALSGGLSRRCAGQAVRTRARALRRFSARRSSSLRPPQTPWSCPASRAHARHCSRTSQRRHTCLASSICRIAGPVLPIGKNSSGSSSRHAERWRQSMGVGTLRTHL